MVHNYKHGDTVKYPVSYCWLWLKNCIASILDLQTEQHFSGSKTSYLHLTYTVIWGGRGTLLGLFGNKYIIPCYSTAT